MWQTPLLLSTILATSSAPGNPLPADSIELLVNSTAAVLLEAFQDPFGSVHVVQDCSSSESVQVHADLLEDVIARLDGSIVLKLGSAEGEVPRRPWIWNVFLVDGLEAFAELYGKMRGDRYEYSGKYLLVFSNVVDEGVIRKVFKDLWKLQIVNVVAIGSFGRDVELWTYYAFSSRACRMVHLQRVSRIAEDELYPDKTSEFHGCLFKVAAFETRPYTIMHRSPGKKLEMSGFESDILEVLKHKLNFRTLIYEPPNGEQWGYPSEHNSTGIMRMIYKEEVDFGMSCLGISVARMKIMKAGIAHHTTTVVLAVPKGRPYTPLEKLIRPFTASVWLLTGIILLIAFISIGIIEQRSQAIREFIYGRSVRTPRLNLIQIFFGLGIPLTPTRNFARTLLFMWIFFCFVLRTLYQSAMFQHLQERANHPPSKTLNEIDETKAFYYVAETGERYFESFPNRLPRSSTTLHYQCNHFKNFSFRVRHLPQEQNNIIRRLDWMEDHPESPDVVMATLDALAHHNLLYRRKGQDPVTICEETITTFSMAIYYPRKSMLTVQFDRQLLDVQASGLMNYWIKQYGNYEFFGQSQENAEPRQLSNEHLMMAYELYGLLVVVSGIIFGIELISERVVMKKKQRNANEKPSKR